MRDPKISIIIPSLNQGIYIEQTILSLISQEYPFLEILVIDGGSTDNTVEVIKKYDSDITYWISEPDKGQAHAINKGLNKVTGDIVNWINSDDFLEPGALQTIGSFFQNNPDKDVLCGYTRCFYDHDNKTSHIYRMGVRSNATDTILKLEMNQPGTFYRTNVMKGLGGVNESLRYVFDNELWIRYLSKYGVSRIGLTEALLAQFRLHGSSKSVGEGFEKFDLEQNAINYSLAEMLNLPDILLEEIKHEERVNYYNGMSFNVSSISRRGFAAFFYLKYLSKWYHQNEVSKAKYALFNIIKSNLSLYPLNRKYISIFFKLLFKF